MNDNKKKPQPRMSLGATAIGYARVSTPQQGLSGVGRAGQEASMRAFADTMNWQYVDTFYDEHTGAGSDSLRKRDGLRRALDLAKKLDSYIITDNWSRLTRHEASMAEIEKSIVDKDRLISVDDGSTYAEASRAGRFARAEAERNEISRRTKEKLQKKKAQGDILGNPDILAVQKKGARAVAEGAALLDHRIADVLRASDRHHSDLTVREVAVILNEAGITTGPGNKWTKTRLRLPLERARELLRREEEEKMRSEPGFAQF